MMALEEMEVEWEPGEREELWRQMQEVWTLRERRRRPLPLIGLFGMVFFLAFSILAAHAFSTRTDGMSRVQVAESFVHHPLPDRGPIGSSLSARSARP